MNQLPMTSQQTILHVELRSGNIYDVLTNKQIVFGNGFLVVEDTRASRHYLPTNEIVHMEHYTRPTPDQLQTHVGMMDGRTSAHPSERVYSGKVVVL